MASELKPCPFCGEKVIMVEKTPFFFFCCRNVMCIAFANTITAKSPCEAIEIWNNRK